MPLLHLLILALIQGITEFLPISSSGHLILLPALTGMQDQGLAIDVAVHVGTLGAVILYFWRDVREAAIGTPRMLTGRTDTPGARLAFLLLIATIPVILIGLVMKVTGLNDLLRSTAVIGATMLIFGVVLWWADRTGPQELEASDWTPTDAIKMGLWQAVALIPGTSRSGITITAGRFLGYTRHDAAKLSMLMSIPTIMASGGLLALDVIGETTPGLLRDAAIGAAFAFAAALAALTLMMRLLRSVSFTPYVIYRIILGAILLAIAFT
ncbi:undecaprenyl-diphosphate phosphatase [Sagittula sp. S175]|uniref:undecaprenyl-diphosphate phosphatase n=1 Tax=Sagittula sp. S175 TaxID=3415129 RepID=UPI003C7A93A6